MNIKKIRIEKDIFAARYEALGAYVTEDLFHNIFLMDRDVNGVFRYVCVYGKSTLIINEHELSMIDTIIYNMAMENHDLYHKETDKVIYSGTAYKPYKRLDGERLVENREVKKFGDIKFYTTLKNKRFYYFIEKNDIRIGGNLDEWRNTLNDLRDLRASYIVREKEQKVLKNMP